MRFGRVDRKLSRMRGRRVQRWSGAGLMDADDESNEGTLTDSAVDGLYGVCQWDNPTQ